MARDINLNIETVKHLTREIELKTGTVKHSAREIELKTETVNLARNIELNMETLCKYFSYSVDGNK